MGWINSRWRQDGLTDGLTEVQNAHPATGFDAVVHMDADSLERMSLAGLLNGLDH